MLGTNPTSEIDRFDQKRKKLIKVTIPSIVKVYNQSMGGVDKADQMIAITRRPLKLKKCYMKMIFHMFNMIVINIRLLYKRYTTLPLAVVPQNSVRHDQVGHRPSVAEADCICHTNVVCTKCNVHLCFNNKKSFDSIP